MEITYDFFQWNTAKNAANVHKHGVSFEEASEVFYDPDVRYIYDEEHSIGEDRFLAIGLSGRLRVLIVCHCYREGDAVRIISARKADRGETLYYGGSV